MERTFIRIDGHEFEVNKFGIYTDKDFQTLFENNPACPNLEWRNAIKQIRTAYKNLQKQG